MILIGTFEFFPRDNHHQHIFRVVPRQSLFLQDFVLTYVFLNNITNGCRVFRVWHAKFA